MFSRNEWRLNVIVCLFVLGVSFSGCENEELKPEPIPPQSSVPVFPDPRKPDIYIAGVGLNKSGVAVATYWKNDSAVSLSSIQSYAHSIAVSGDDVFVVGQQHGVATCWKNGSAVPLTNQTDYSSAFSVFVSGDDVYISGTVSGNNGHLYGVYWKNGIMVPLTEGTTYSQVSQILVSGNDVYVTGSTYHEGKEYAAFWKNGNLTELTDGTTSAHAYSIAVSGNDVYVTISENYFSGAISVAKYWKNGKIVPLTDGTSYSIATSIIVSGDDVYVSGLTRGVHGGGSSGIATYWKNGVAINNPSDSPRSMWVYSIAVVGNDVYTVGSVDESPMNSSVYSAAKYWKNGTPVTLPQGYDGINVNYAAAILVVNKGDK